MRTVRASEIGSYIYCQRAWWYSVNGVDPQNQEILDHGLKHHQAHWRTTIYLKLMRGTAFILLILGIVFIILQLFAD